jgi:hypothetical protein
MQLVESGSLVRDSAGNAPHTKNLQDIKVADN